MLSIKSTKLKKFLIILLLLFISGIITSSVGYNYSIDMKAWWPFVLIIGIILYLIYAGLFLLIDNIHPTPQKYVIVYNSILSLILTIIGTLFHTIKIDWLAVNNGEKTLTLFQLIISNDSTYFLVLGLFLIIHLVFVNLKRK